MILLPFLLACAQPLHMQYDFGRSYVATTEIQATLDRPSVANAAPMLSGAEALALRANAAKATTEEKSGEVESTKSEGK